MGHFLSAKNLGVFFTAAFLSLTAYAQADLEPYPMDINAGDEFGVQQKAWGKTYILGTLSTVNVIDFDQPTHILTAGSAKNKESDQFFQSAYLRAKMYQALYPQDQVVILAQPEVTRASNEEVYERYDVTIVEEKDGKLTGNTLIKELDQFKNIKSFDFYGHSSPWAIKLGKSDAAMGAESYTAVLKDNFTADAYATLNGCNGGFEIAPGLSKYWNIPVSGALTGSLFERLQADGKYYKKADRTESEAAMENIFNFATPLHCWDGGCWRMKPQRNNYSSYWGHFKEGGLSFYKFFCNFSDNSGKCEKVMAKSLLSFPTAEKAEARPSWSSFEARIFDYLCSTAKDPSYFGKCKDGILAALKKGDNVFQAHPGNALNCNFKTCNAVVKCKTKSRLFGGGIKAGSCKLDTKENKKPTTLVREYLSYKKGFQLLFN